MFPSSEASYFCPRQYRNPPHQGAKSAPAPAPAPWLSLVLVGGKHAAPQSKSQKEQEGLEQGYVPFQLAFDIPVSIQLAAKSRTAGHQRPRPNPNDLTGLTFCSALHCTQQHGASTESLGLGLGNTLPQVYTTKPEMKSTSMEWVLNVYYF